MKTVLAYLVRAAAMLGVLSLSAAFAPAQNSDSTEINNLLKQVKTHAVSAEDDAQTLESYSFSAMGFQSHANRLTQIKEHANDLIADFNKLGELRSSGSPWQQEAIDRIQPLLQSMSSQMTGTINHLNQNQSQVNMPPYRDHVKATSKLMTKTARLIADYADYAETKAEVAEHAQGLGVLPAPRANW